MTISKTKLIKVLDGMEKQPAMYGNCGEIELAYWILLYLLEPDKHEKRLSLFARECKLLSGNISNMSLSNFTTDYNVLIKSLQKIRSELLE
jgi:hypothetical protein